MESEENLYSFILLLKVLLITALKQMTKKSLPVGSLQREEDSKFIPEISSGMFIFMTDHEIIAPHCKPRHLKSLKRTMTKDA